MRMSPTGSWLNTRSPVGGLLRETGVTSRGWGLAGGRVSLGVTFEKEIFTSLPVFSPLRVCG